MPLRRTVLAFLVSILTLACSPLAAAQADYEILLNRPWRAGMKLHVTAEGTRTDRQEVHTGGQPQVMDSSVEVRLAGVFEVVRVDEQGRVREYRLTLDEGRIVVDGETTTLEKGSVLRAVIVNEDDTTYDLNGASFTGRQAEAVDQVFTLADSSQDEDKIWGAEERKKIGDTWPINREAAVESSRDQIVLKADALSGSTTLVETTNVAGTECLRLRANMESNDFQLVGLPPTITVKRGKFAAQMDGAFPTDPALPLLKGESSMVLDVHAGGAVDDGTGAPVQLDVFLQIQGTRKFDARLLD